MRYGKLVSKMIAHNIRCTNEEAYAIVRSVEEAVSHSFNHNLCLYFNFYSNENQTVDYN